MKKYIIINSDGSQQNVMKAEHNTHKEAVDELVEYVDNYNSGTHSSENNYVSPFDFIIDEVEFMDTNELIPNFKYAQKSLDLYPNDDIEMIARKDALVPQRKLLDIRKLIEEINPRYISKFIALNQLYTIMEAWNKRDKFIPDNSKAYQYKWHPYFVYNKDTSKFKFGGTSYSNTFASDVFVFKSSERAEQFGKMFSRLFNEVFL